MTLQLSQELLMHRIFNNTNRQKCSHDGYLTLNGGFERRIRTSLGEFKWISGISVVQSAAKTFAAAATYIRRAKLWRLGYIKRWLKRELIPPRASSMVERVMREPDRRLKKTACGWSDKGATKIARIILKRFTNAKAWENYWQNKMNCEGNVAVNIGNYKCFSQNSGQ